jgi:hypothetical protein
MNIERRDEYRVSPRVILRPGVRFRAQGGPFVRLADGTTVSLKPLGPYTFRRWLRQGDCEWIEAGDRQGSHCILHIAGQRKSVDEAVVTRPYHIRSTIRKRGRGR